MSANDSLCHTFSPFTCDAAKIMFFQENRYFLMEIEGKWHSCYHP